MAKIDPTILDEVYSIYGSKMFQLDTGTPWKVGQSYTATVTLAYSISMSKLTTLRLSDTVGNPAWSSRSALRKDLSGIVLVDHQHRPRSSLYHSGASTARSVVTTANMPSASRTGTERVTIQISPPPASK